MKSILVATDLSTRSDRAVQRALRLSALLAVPCHVISVVDDDLPGDMVARRLKDVGERLERFVGSLAAPGQPVTTLVLAGDPVGVISAQAEALDIGLLVLGIHRLRPFMDLLRDTTMARIVRSSLRPVLLVTDPADHEYRKVLVPVSFSPACAAALRIATTVAPDATLRSFHAVMTPFSGLTGEGPASAMAQVLRAEAATQRDAWSATLELGKDKPDTEILSGNLSEILSRMASDRPDLIAVGAHTRSSFTPHVLGSFVADLIRTPPCDVLVARA